MISHERSDLIKIQYRVKLPQLMIARDMILKAKLVKQLLLYALRPIMVAFLR